MRARVWTVLLGLSVAAVSLAWVRAGSADDEVSTAQLGKKIVNLKFRNEGSEHRVFSAARRVSLGIFADHCTSQKVYPDLNYFPHRGIGSEFPRTPTLRVQSMNSLAPKELVALACNAPLLTVIRPQKC